MDLANLRDRSHQLELGDRQAGVAEQRQPVRQGERRSGSDRGDRGAVPLHRRGRVDLRGDPAPELRLPRQVRVDVAAGPVTVPARRPVLEHPRPVPRIPREEPGDPAGDGPPSFLPQLVRVALVTLPEVPGERVAPRLVEARVDDREHPPDQPFGVPRVGVVGVGEQPDERGRPHEVDTRAYPVAVLVGPEPVREPLGQPALDALGGHHDELAGEHPTDRLPQELTELVGEQVRARVDVHGQPHGSTVCVRSDDQGRWSSATKRMVWRPSTAAMLLELDPPIFRPGLRPRVGLKRARPCGRRRWDVRIRAATFERGCCQGCCPAGRLRRIELLSSIGCARRVASQIRACDLGCRAKSLTNVPAPAWEACQRPPAWAPRARASGPSAGRCCSVVWRSCRTWDARGSGGRRSADRRCRRPGASVSVGGWWCGLSTASMANREGDRHPTVR